MPSRTEYKRRDVLRSPIELIRWFDSVKSWRKNPQMRSFREQFTIISNNKDADWSLFRAKFRGDVLFLKEEAKFVMDKLRIKRDDGRPLWAGLDLQMEIGDYGYVRPTIKKVLNRVVKNLKSNG